MISLVEQYIWFLLAAFIIGALIGWMTCGRPSTG